MKNSILLMTLLIVAVTSTTVFGGGEGAGAGGNEGSKIGRGIASVEPAEVEPEATLESEAKRTGSACLVLIGSDFKLKSSDTDFRNKLDVAIKEGLLNKKKNKQELPKDECRTYAHEATTDETIRSFYPKKISVQPASVEGNTVDEVSTSKR